MTDDQKNARLSPILTAVALQIALFPANAILFIKMASSAWGWFLASRFGEGPTDGQWFGLSVLHLLFTFKQDSPREEAEEDAAVRKSPVGHVLTRFLTKWFILGITFGVATVVGLLMGWRI